MILINRRFVYGIVFLSVVLLITYFLSSPENSEDVSPVKSVLPDGTVLFTNLPESSSLRESFSDLRGSIYLSLAPRNTAMTYLYRVDIPTFTLEKILEDNLLKSTSHISPQSDAIAYMAAPRSNEIIDLELLHPIAKPMDVYIRNFQENKPKKITDTKSILNRLPRWSPDGTKIAFVGQPYENFYKEVLHIPDEWHIWITDIQKEETQAIGKGLYPFWSPSGTSLVVLQNDGIFEYDIMKKTPNKILGAKEVFGAESVASILMQINISNDKTLLAWHYTKLNTIKLFKIVSWEPFKVEFWKEFKDPPGTFSTWPIFSPDNKYLAMIKSDTGGPYNEEGENVRLSVRNIKTGDETTLMFLNDFDYYQSFMSEWRHERISQ